MRQVWEMKNTLELMVDQKFSERKICSFCNEQATRLIRFTWNKYIYTDFYCCEEQYLLLEPYFYEIKRRLAELLWTNFQQGKPGYFDGEMEKILKEYLAKASTIPTASIPQPNWK